MLTLCLLPTPLHSSSPRHISFSKRRALLRTAFTHNAWRSMPVPCEVSAECDMKGRTSLKCSSGPAISPQIVGDALLGKASSAAEQAKFGWNDAVRVFVLTQSQCNAKSVLVCGAVTCTLQFGVTQPCN